MGNSCPVQSIFNFLSKRWMLLILKSIIDGKDTFGDIKKGLGGMSARVLSERLTELQNEDYITRTIIQEKPIKIRYNITKKGQSLGECLSLLDNWVRENC